MMMARVARIAAALIAVAAILDPAVAVTMRLRGTVAVVEPAGSHVAERLRRDYQVVNGFDADSAVVVVAGDSYPSEAVAADARVATVSLPRPPRRVRLSRVDAPESVPPATAIRIDATIVADRPAPSTTTVVARIGGIVVGEASHAWTADTTPWRAVFDVVPVGAAPWPIVVSADGDENVVLVDRSPPISVLFYEPRPSWTTTFVRRALERDGRFAVEAVTRLGEPTAAAVVVGGLDRVSDADATTLGRFVRERGGALVALPDDRIDARSPLASLLQLPSDEREVLLEQPAPLAAVAPLPALAASELLTFGALDPAADVLARTAGVARAVVWSGRRGSGRVFVSGALDAWRFRGTADDAFDRFFRAAIAGAALGTRPSVDVRVVPSAARPLETVRVHARVHPWIAAANEVAVSATLAEGERVRLWPDAEVGAFSGAFVLPANATTSRVQVRADGAAASAIGSAAFASVPAAVHSVDSAIPLSLLSASHGGVNVSPDDLAPLDRWLRAVVTAPMGRVVRRPMRSPWWMVPFAACLSIDWWFTSSRRRRR